MTRITENFESSKYKTVDQQLAKIALINRTFVGR
jgi:hypothetical protein